jgi:nicotinamidase-related amidase
MLHTQNSVLVLVDIQSKLAERMHEKEALLDNLQRLIRGMQALQVPILWAEQIPDKMGPTVECVRQLLNGLQPIAKASFSCYGDARFLQALAATGRKQAIVAGIEAHVCVLQTAVDLEAHGYRVDVVADAVSSRTLSNKLLALERMKASGVHLASVELVLFELMRTAEHPAFRDVLRIVK